MKKLFKTVSIVSAICLSSTVFAETRLKLAHSAPESDLQQTMSVYFKDQVEARTNGDIKIDIFPHGQLGTDEQMMDGTRAGIVDFNIIGEGFYAGFIPEIETFTLPFIFPNRDAAYAVLDGELGAGILKKMETINLKGLGYPENGYRNMTNDRGSIRTPGDVKGLRMRVNASKPLNDMFNILGANPQQLPIAELYTALETGVVNAQEHPIPVTLSFKFNEVQDYLSLTQHSYSQLVLTMNLKKFNKLSENDQEIITEAAADAVKMQRALSISKEEEMISKLESEGMKVNRDVDTKAFKVAVKPVWDEFIEIHGDEFINKISAVTDKY